MSRWNKARLAAVAAYLLCACGLGFRSPGLHYDEAIFVNGAVQMLSGRQDLAFAAEAFSWVRISGRQWPLMVLPYAGPMRSYASVVPFAIFGVSTTTARVVTTLLGALGIWGFSVLIGEQFGAQSGALTAWILAVNPAYLASTIYDPGGVNEWMAPAGVVSLALARYLRGHSTGSAFLLGLAAGFAIWTRANLAWLLASAAVAGAIMLGKRMLVPARHFAAICAGGVLGGAAFLWYEIQSGGGIFTFMRGMNNPKPLLKLIPVRLEMLAQTMLCDSEHRAMWGGPKMPLWQMIFFPALLAFALYTCLDRKAEPGRRILGLVFWLVLACMLSSSLFIAEHHLIALLPIAAALVTLAGQDSWRRWRYGRYGVGIAAVTYLACALNWNLMAAERIRSTGGVDRWSNAIDSLAGFLEKDCDGRKIKILDWGLENSLFVVSSGRLAPAEIFWGSTSERAGTGRLWTEEIVPGDVYVTHATDLAAFPDAEAGFSRGLAALGLPFRRREFFQNHGCPFAETFEILPRKAP